MAGSYTEMLQRKIEFLNLNTWEDKRILEYKKISFVNNCFREPPLYAETLSIFKDKPYIYILDWGGGFGHYYQLTRVIIPNVTISFHCVDLPKMVEIGRRVNPDVHFYSDKNYINKYDLVMINGSLNYVKDWEKLLDELMPLTDYFLLNRTPINIKSKDYKVQKYCGVKLKHYIIDEDKLFHKIDMLGFKVIKSEEIKSEITEKFTVKGYILKR